MFSSKPRHLVTVFVIFQVLVLWLIPAAISKAPALDVVEGLSWAQHWLIGTYKHPPMPSWLLGLMQFVIPSPIVGPLLASQLVMAVTYWLGYKIAREFVGEIEAAAATLLLVGSAYMAVPSLQLNHNVMQFPFWAGAILLYAQLRREPLNAWRWVALGLVAGAGLYSKYSFLLLLVILFATTFADRKMRPSLKSPYPYLAVAVALVVFTPHLVWLVQNHFSPLNYAERSSSRSETLFLPMALQPLLFLGAQVAFNLGILIFLAVARVAPRPVDRQLVVEPSDLNFIRVMTFGPLLLTTLLFLVAGSGLKSTWGMPMFTTIGLWVVMELRHRWTLAEMRRMLWSAMTVVALVAAGTVAGLDTLATREPLPRRMWPMYEIAAQADAIWRAQTPKPLRIVGGNTWIAGLVSAGDAQRPYLFIHDSYAETPWISKADLLRDGALFFDYSPDPPPEDCKIAGPPQRIILSDKRVPTFYVSTCLPAG